MHELGLIQEVIAIAEQASAGQPVRKIVLEVGALALALPDALEFAFELAREGTVAADATLEIVRVPGRARCRRCHAEIALENAQAACPCGSHDLEWLSGEGIQVRALEVEAG